MNPIVLYCPPAAGKLTVGKKLDNPDGLRDYLAISDAYTSIRHRETVVIDNSNISAAETAGLIAVELGL